MKSNVIKVVSNGDMSANIVSDAMPLDQIYGFAVQAVYSGSPVGSIKLQASCDPFPLKSNVANGGPYVVQNWDDIVDSSIALPVANNIVTWNVNLAFYRFVRVVYTFTSGTGTLNVNLSVKGA